MYCKEEAIVQYSTVLHMRLAVCCTVYTVEVRLYLYTGRLAVNFIENDNSLQYKKELTVWSVLCAVQYREESSSVRDMEEAIQNCDAHCAEEAISVLYIVQRRLLACCTLRRGGY